SGSSRPPGGGGSGGSGSGGSMPNVPEVPAVSSYGGLLYNGDFVLTNDGGPAGWSKYGGEMRATRSAFRGASAVELSSATDTVRWVHQAVGVQPNSWYRVDVQARRQNGTGEVFIRVSWYASFDGSGSYIEQVDSPITTSPGWTLLSTGPI